MISIRQNFTQDYASTSFEQVFSGGDKEKLLNQVICQHMYRHGFLEIGEELARVCLKLYLRDFFHYIFLFFLVQESGLEMQEHIKQPFVTLNEILENLRNKNLEPALLWTQMHRQALIEQSSSLEFKLHRLHFLNLVAQGPEKQSEALAYVRNYFPPFVRQHETGQSTAKIDWTASSWNFAFFRRYSKLDGHPRISTLRGPQFSLQEVIRSHPVDGDMWSFHERCLRSVGLQRWEPLIGLVHKSVVDNSFLLLIRCCCVQCQRWMLIIAGFAQH